MKSVKEAWTKIVYHFDEQPLGIDALRGLVENKYAAIVLKNVFDKEILNISTKVIRRHFEKAIVTRYSNGTLTTIGPYLAKYLNRIDNIDNYFREAQVTDSLFPKRLDISHHVREQLQCTFGLRSLEIATEPDGQKYAPFVVRIHSDGVMNPLHNDNIMRDAGSTGLLLAQLRYQLSCIICIQECDDGGNLRHYFKQWTPDDEKHKIPNGIGYDYEVVKEKPCFVFKPEIGDVYLINPTNYHEIDRVSGKERITVGFFIGFFNQDLKDGVIWT